MTQNSTVYCWFDWDDDTTSVNNLNIVKEPRKPWNEYFPGEEITANLPKYGLWKGVIVETSESKKDLEKKMKDRQQLQAEMVECETSQCKTYKTDKRKRKEDKTKNCTSNDNERIEEKRRKKELDRNKLEAVNKQLEEIVQRRRLAISDSDSHPYRDESNQHAGEISNTLSTDMSKSDHCNVNTELGKRFDLTAYADRNLYASNTAFQPYIPPQNYSFLEDLYRSSGTSYQTLQTPQEQLNDVHLKNQALEEENRQLKEEVSRLKEEVEMLKSSTTMLPGVPAVTPTKITFLKQLTSALEDKRSFGMRANNEIVLHTDVQSPIRPKPVRLFSPAEHQAESTNNNNPIQHCDKQDSCEVSAPLNTWEEPYTSSGNPKIKLVADYDVYLTQAQLSQANLRANGNPRKLVITLLDTFFTRDRLAESSALGAKSAHNKKDDKASVPLPSIVLSSLKLYVLRLHKRPNGEPCLTDAVFNDIINQKCATARRSLKTL